MKVRAWVIAMITKVAVVDEQHIDDATIREAGDTIKAGGLVAFPTETVYGLGGDALNKESSRKIYEAKGRPSDNPLIVHIAKFEDIYLIVREVPEAAERLAEAFLAGAVNHDSAKVGQGSKGDHGRAFYRGHKNAGA